MVINLYIFVCLLLDNFSCQFNVNPCTVFIVFVISNKLMRPITLKMKSWCVKIYGPSTIYVPMGKLKNISTYKVPTSDTVPCHTIISSPKAFKYTSRSSISLSIFLYIRRDVMVKKLRGLVT